MGTDFRAIYKQFYSKITDDMYMELDEVQTYNLSEELLINAIPWFEFPRVSLEYVIEDGYFESKLSKEEINILATYMMVGWLDQQLANIELVRMKYSGSDFKFTSQANHLAKLLALKKDYERTGFHLQRLYKRRAADGDGIMRSTLSSIMSSSVRTGAAAPKHVCCRKEDEVEWNDFPLPKPGTDNNENSGNNNSGNEGGSDSWEDMGDLPLPGGGGSSEEPDGWEGMEDLPSSGNEGNDDDWGSI